MTDWKARISEIEAQAAEFELIARLAAAPEIRIRNTKLVDKLREEAAQLKATKSPRHAHGSEGASHA